MKKGLFSILAGALLVVGCQNYDDQFSNIESQITALASQVAGLSQVQSDLTALAGTVNSLQSSVEETVDSALADGLADIDQAVIDLNAATETAASATAVQAIADALIEQQEDLTELLEQSSEPIDYIFLPVGGGGLISGISGVFKQLSPKTKIIGVEPLGAASMTKALEEGQPTRLEHINKFIDGASVQKVGALNFQICQDKIDRMTTVPEGKVCQSILDLYNKDAIVVEPAGALSVAVLDQFREEIKGKNVVCIISGSNNDITRTEEIKELALLHAGLKHYFIIRFPQRAGALKEFISEVLGPEDDITHFEYSKKHNRNQGPAVIGIELKHADSLEGLKQRMIDRKFFGEYLNDKPDLFQYLV